MHWWLSTGCPVWPPSARLTRLPYPTLPPCFLSQCNQIFVYIPNCSNKFKLTFDSISELNLTELIALNWIFNFSSICMGMQYTLKCLFQHTYTSIRYTLHKLILENLNDKSIISSLHLQWFMHNTNAMSLDFFSQQFQYSPALLSVVQILISLCKPQALLCTSSSIPHL